MVNFVLQQVAGVGPTPERATRAECLLQSVAVDFRATVLGGDPQLSTNPESIVTTVARR